MWAISKSKCIIECLYFMVWPLFRVFGRNSSKFCIVFFFRKFKTPKSRSEIGGKKLWKFAYGFSWLISTFSIENFRLRFLFDFFLSCSGKFKQESLFPATYRWFSHYGFIMRQICVKCFTVQKGGMTLTEYKTMFTLWCIVKSPLILGSDLRTMEENDEAYKVRNRFYLRTCWNLNKIFMSLRLK